MGIVDVRDVAMAHVLAMKVPDAKVHRFITWNGSHWKADMAKILAEKYSSDGWPIVTEEGPDTGDTQSKVDVSPSTDLLGLKYTDLKDTLLDMA